MYLRSEHFQQVAGEKNRHIAAFLEEDFTVDVISKDEAKRTVPKTI